MRSVWQDRAVSLVGAFVILCAVSPVQAQLGDPFETAAPSLAIVTTHSGTGSGFILEMDEKKYLITNEHVLRGGKPVTARLLSGDRLVFSTLEVADQCDLVRLLLIDQTVAGLQMAIDQPTIGDAVSVFGNSEGSGVVTAISGKILGIGPDRIEVDAAFVRGNSGSPILLQDGTVLAVATYVERGAHASDWIKSGTRFTKPRRFGMKLDNVEWIVLSEDDYFVRADALTDLHTYCIDVYDLLQADVYDTGNRYQAFSYSIEKNRSKFRRNHKFAQLLAEAVFKEHFPKGVEPPSFADCMSEAEVGLGTTMLDGKKSDNSLDIMVRVGEWLICIEQKVLSSEGSRQLKRYSDALSRRCSPSRLLCFYLTPDRKAGSDERWIPISHQDLLLSMAQVLRRRVLFPTARHNLRTLLWDLMLGPVAQDERWIDIFARHVKNVARDPDRYYAELSRWLNRYNIDQDCRKILMNLVEV